MGASKEYFLIMREEDFNRLPPDLRASFLHVEVREANEYEIHKSDPIYQTLYKKQKQAKKELQEYLFKKRHK